MLFYKCYLYKKNKESRCLHCLSKKSKRCLTTSIKSWLCWTRFTTQ
uniref:Uncharacterized protein n=1 Tax=Microviridae sp. ctpIT6 TaxID=2827650 RepID=A0A8S5SUF8_9VIRU|nr:MAG TPA: hypothetical protein [Microviridae sp. ctpIT6]